MFEKVIKGLPNCSAIKKEDQFLYESFFSGNYDNIYSKNWQFIQQITQDSKGIKYFDKEKGHLITIAPDWGGNIPNYIYLPLGNNAIESLPNLAKALSNIINAPVIIKKVYGKQDREYLLSRGFKDTNFNENKEGDDKYPEIIVDVDLLIDSAINQKNIIDMHYYQRRIKKVLRNIASGEWVFSEIDLNENLDVDFKCIVDKWSKDFAVRATKKGINHNQIIENVSSVYYPQFLKICKNQTYCYITYLNSQPVSFTSAYAISNNCLAVNGSLCDISFKGLIQYLFLQLAYKAKSDGYKFLNLGSNDNESQDQYKSRMGMVLKNYTYSFIYNN